MARDMRPELLGSKAQKIRFWIDDVDIKVKRRLDERIKIIPEKIKRSVTPSKESKMSKAKRRPGKSQFKKDQESSYQSDEDVVILSDT